MNRRTFGVALAAGALLLASCTEVPASEPGAPAETNRAAPSTRSADPAVERARLLPADLATLPRLRTGLPRDVPDAAENLPSLIGDPPGRVSMVYHPHETWDHSKQGWDSETVLFFGRDQTWRRLNLGDLGLDEAAWPGPDTFGAGRLSPDGRWWASHSIRGIILLDLTTGRARLVELPEPEVWQLTWLPNSRSLVAYYGSGPAEDSVRVSVPDLTMTPVRYKQHQVGFEPDGTPVSMERTRAGARLVEWRGSRKTLRVPVPAWLTESSLPQGVVASQESFATRVQADNYTTNSIVVVESESGEVTGILKAVDTVLGIASDRWMNDDLLLLDTANHVLAWRPGRQRLYRVTSIPAGDGYWTADFAPAAAR